MPVRSPQEVWGTALGSLQVQVSPTVYETWLGRTTGLAFDGHEFIVGAPNAFVAEWLQRRMRSLLERTLAEVLQHPVRVVVEVAESSDPIPPPVGTGHSPLPAPDDRSLRRPLGQTPDPRLTFETFIDGAGSRLARAAARAVADDPGHAYNPLLVHGAVGLGKTHLLHAVAHVAQERRATLLTTAEGFVNDFVGALRQHRSAEFRAHYRSVDVLILDDLEFICGKRKSEESLLHTCTALLQEGKQIVAATSQSPADLPFLQRRLASQFQAGLLVDLRPPDYRSRLAILAFKASRLAEPMPDEVLHMLASHPSTSIRQMEGELTKVAALASLLSEHITPALAARALTPERALPARPATPTILLRAAAAYFQLPLSTLTGPSRERLVTHARQITMHLLRGQTDASLERIGRLIGGRDHTTVLHAIHKIDRLTSTDPSIAEAEQAILHIASSS